MPITSPALSADTKHADSAGLVSFSWPRCPVRRQAAVPRLLSPVTFPAGAAPAPEAGRVALVNRSSPEDDYYSGHFCGAVLIQADLLATVSHCVTGRDASLIDASSAQTTCVGGSPCPGRGCRLPPFSYHRHLIRNWRCCALAQLLQLNQCRSVRRRPILVCRSAGGTVRRRGFPLWIEANGAADSGQRAL